ncbi:MAG: peptide chain release factor 1 [Clostridiales bacterium]|nr:peptide chain release factor 1 [Clostridiales bacterium]
MYDKLKIVEQRYNELTEEISKPEVIADQANWRKLMKEHGSIEEIVNKYKEYKQVKADIDSAKEMLNDKELHELAQMEIVTGEEKLLSIEEELKILLLPKDPNDDKNVIVEIRGGAGGEEAALFAGVLFRMYSRYAERHRWKVEIMNDNPTGLGGYKEVVFMISGAGAYSKLKFESGVHRVQRVPETEASGRIHTSTVTVAVLPELEDVEVEINPADLKIDTYRSSGAGGQHVNKTESAIRITHMPTGIVVACQEERSQIQNRERAMTMLRAKLFEAQEEERNKKMASDKKMQVGTGDRSEKIRTYNYPQGRITDHRIKFDVFQMEAFLDGELDEMIDALNTADRAIKLSATQE